MTMGTPDHWRPPHKWGRHAIRSEGFSQHPKVTTAQTACSSWLELAADAQHRDVRGRDQAGRDAQRGRARAAPRRPAAPAPRSISTTRARSACCRRPPPRPRRPRSPSRTLPCRKGTRWGCTSRSWAATTPSDDRQPGPDRGADAGPPVALVRDVDERPAQEVADTADRHQRVRRNVVERAVFSCEGEPRERGADQGGVGGGHLPRVVVGGGFSDSARAVAAAASSRATGSAKRIVVGIPGTHSQPVCQGTGGRKCAVSARARAQIFRHCWKPDVRS